MTIDSDRFASWHLALAQPLLRGPDGTTWIVRPGPAAGSVRAERLPGPEGEPLWCLGHGQHRDPVPWLATDAAVHALLDGHRPLAIAPPAPWAGPWRALEAPYRSVVALPALGLHLFLVAQHGPAPGTRVFAVDGQQAVEAAPWPGVHVHAAWCDGESLWACGQTVRQCDDEGDVTDTGRGVLLRAPLRPLGAPEVLEASDALRIPAALDERHPDLAQRLARVETWLAAYDAGDGDRWLIGAAEPPDGPLGADLLDRGPVPRPGDHRDVVCARRSADGTLRLHALWTDRQWLLDTLDLQGRPLAWLRGVDDAVLHRLTLSPDDGWVSAPLQFEGGPERLEALDDVDLVQHPDFGMAAMLAWWAPTERGRPPAREGGLYASRDGLRWRFVHRL